MFIDEAEITVTGGHGGPGKVAFFPMKKGPCGGNGGKGGNIYVAVNKNISDLRKYVERISYEAENGKQGDSNNKEGASGEDLHLHVPVGTTIIDFDTNDEVELTAEDQEVLLAQGGEGGRGNDAFKTSTYQTPRKSEPGEEGQIRHLKFIQKLIADFGLIGLPNAGKSSLLNELTAANVKTANYPFTTLEPNLGVINEKVIADIPGLIEGASTGKGLGIKFLKHIEKVKLLLHCISVESEDVEKDYKTVTEELSRYNKEILNKETIILLTKIDLAAKEEVQKKIKQLKKLKKEILPISIHDWDSLEKLKSLL